MADFRTHLLGAATVSGVASTVLVMTGQVSHSAIVSYFALGVAGGLLPDIDSDSSIPVRIAFNALAVSGGFLLVFTFGQRYSLIELTLLWLGCFILVRYGAFNLFTRLTVHRGLIHSIPAGICFALLTTYLAHHAFAASALHAWFYGVFLLLGFITHLLLDELYSVDLLGMEFKASFGSALSLGSLTNLPGTIALYLVLLMLAWLSPPTDTFAQFVLNSDTYHPISSRLLPAQGWFDGLFDTLLRGV